MAMGLGRYDELCSMVARAAGIGDGGGGVVVIVLGGDKGPGFSCHADAETLLMLPEMLEHVARQMRDDMGSA